MVLPIKVDGWYLLDHDSAMYHREAPEGHEFIDMTWLDTTSEDSEYGTGREYCVCAATEEERDFDQAELNFRDLHHVDAFCISDVVTKEEAKKIILDYISNH